jgi:hypothetical protein
MNKQLLSIFLSILFSSLSAFSQLSLSYNRPRPGDKLVQYQVEYKDPGKTGENVLWDFGKLKTVNENYTLTYSAPETIGDSLYVLGSRAYPKSGVDEGDLLVASEHHTQYYFRFKGDTLLLLGHENPLTRLEYVLPYVQAIFPIRYGDITTYPYRARGLYSQTDSISTEGLVTTWADARGRMVLPSGDTLGQVMRVRTMQGITDNRRDSLGRRTQRVLETCRWYARGYRYPVFETVRSYNPADSTVHFKTAFFYPPQDHYYLADDPQNKAIQDELWGQDNKDKGAKAATGTETDAKGVSIPGVLSCKLYPNPVETVLTVAYEVSMKANVSFGLYSIDGFPVEILPARPHEPGTYSLTFNCSGLFPRNYILRVTANDKVANGLVIKK